MVEPWLVGLDRAKPEKITEGHFHVDPTHAGRTIKVGWNVVQAEGEGEYLAVLIAGGKDWLQGH